MRRRAISERFTPWAGLALGTLGGKADAAFLPALADKDPARRAAAALVVGRGGTPEQKASVRSLASFAAAAL